MGIGLSVILTHERELMASKNSFVLSFVSLCDTSLSKFENSAGFENTWLSSWDDGELVEDAEPDLLFLRLSVDSANETVVLGYGSTTTSGKGGAGKIMTVVVAVAWSVVSGYKAYSLIRDFVVYTEEMSSSMSLNSMALKTDFVKEMEEHCLHATEM